MKFKKSTDKSNKPEVSILSGDVSNATTNMTANSLKDNKNKKVLLLVFMATIILALVFIGVLFINTKNHNNKDQAIENNTTNSKNVIKSAESIEIAIKNENDKSKRAELYSDLSTTKQLEGDLDGAIEATNKSIGDNATPTNYSMLAGLYERKQEYIKAIEFYKKTLELLTPTEDPDQNTDYTYIKGKISELEAKI